MDFNVSILSSLIDSIPDAVIAFDQRQRILFYNHGARLIFQYTPEEALNLPLRDLLPLESHELQSQHVEDVKKLQNDSGQTLYETKEVRGRRKNGTSFPAEASINKTFVEEKLIYLVILRDISDRKTAQDSLLKSENRYRGLVESQSNLIIRVNMQNQFTFVNQAYCETFGKTELELLGNTFTPTIHPEDLPTTNDAISRLYEPPHRIMLEQRAMTVHGWRWFAWEIAIIQDKTGSMIEIQTVGRDVSESKQNKQLLITQRDLAQKLAGTVSLHEALVICLEQILLEAGMDCGGVYLIDPHSSDLNLVHSQGLSEAFTQAASIYQADSDRWNLVMQGKIIHSNFKFLPVKKNNLFESEGLKGFTLLPITYQDKVIGCFNLASHELDIITPGGQTAAEAIAMQMGITLMRLMAEKQLAESQEELEILFNTINDFLVAFDQNGNIIKVNQQVVSRLEYSEAELLGQPVLKLHPLEHHPQATVILQEMLAGNLDTCPLELISKSGQRIMVETKVNAGKIRGQSVWIGISRDISERKAADDSLRRSKEQLTLAIEGSGVGMWDWMVETGETIFNERWAEIAGYTLEELAPVNIDTWTRLCHPDDLTRSDHILQEHFDGKRPIYECELRIRHKSGHWVWVLDRGRVTERNTSGEPIRMTGTHLDITERHMMEEKLRIRLDFENLLTKISTRFINLNTGEIDKEITAALQDIGNFENIDRSYVFVVDRSTDTMSNSHEWCRQGIEPQMDALQGLPTSLFPWWMLKLESNEPIVVTQIDELPLEASEEKEILKSQSILSVAVVPLFVNNQLLGFAGFDSVREEKSWEQDSIALLQQFGNSLGNLLERKRVENALGRSEERNAAILRAIPDNMFRITKDGIILDAIVSDFSSLIIPPEQIKGTKLALILGTDLARIALKKIQDAISIGQMQTMDYHYNLRNQTEHFEARYVASGKNEVIAIVRNVSERARLEQMKSDFIHRATHDLRTPLTTILLMVRLLEEECTPEEYQEYWNILKEELDRERVLIEDLLTVGRLESNQWVVKQQPVDPLECLQKSIQTIAPQAAQKQIQLLLKDSPEKFLVLGESSSLEQIFTNLLNNAVKFTPGEGQVEISYFQQAKRGYFRVRDHGIGIPAEDLPHLYTRFFRGRNAIEKEIPGSGIGLFIIKSMIGNFGGQIELKSELGFGTTVEFWLPIASEEVAGLAH